MLMLERGDSAPLAVAGDSRAEKRARKQARAERRARKVARGEGLRPGAPVAAADQERELARWALAALDSSAVV